VVPGAGIEPARLAAGDFLTTSAFAAIVPKHDVCGLEHAFTLAYGLRCPPSALYTFRNTFRR